MTYILCRTGPSLTNTACVLLRRGVCVRVKERGGDARERRRRAETNRNVAKSQQTTRCGLCPSGVVYRVQQSSTQTHTHSVTRVHTHTHTHSPANAQILTHIHCRWENTTAFSPVIKNAPRSSKPACTYIVLRC